MGSVDVTFRTNEPAAINNLLTDGTGGEVPAFEGG